MSNMTQEYNIFSERQRDISVFVSVIFRMNVFFDKDRTVTYTVCNLNMINDYDV